MAFIHGGNASFFSEDTYKEYAEERKPVVKNERFRLDHETIWDVVCSEEADFTNHPEGQSILEAIRSYK